MSACLCVYIYISGADLFSDLKDAEQRELAIGFVDQLKSGKPAGVINMVMRSRNVGDALIARINKAAGTSAGGGGGGGGAGAAAAAEIKKKGKDKEKDKDKDKDKNKSKGE